MKLIPVRTVFILMTPTANLRQDVHMITMPAAPWEEPERMMVVTGPQPKKKPARASSKKRTPK